MIANLYYRLNGIAEYALGDTTNEQALQQAYQEVKADIVKFEAADDFDTIKAYFDGKYNLLWNFQKAQELFEEAE